MQISGGKYVLEEVIAAGSFGKVYRHRQFAIKELRIPAGYSTRAADSLRKNLRNEINILIQLNHPNIVKLHEVIEEPNAVYIVMELCQNDLRKISEQGPVGERKAFEVMRQVVEGYREVVKFNIVHRDLKPANILFDKGTYKLADFGMARYVQSDEDGLLRSHVGTPFYMSPQILQRIQYSRKCDVWSMGVIFYELIFGQLPWQGKNQCSLLNNVMSLPLRFPSYVSHETREILEKMLTVSEFHRASWEQVLKLFQLQEKREVAVEVKEYHWSVVRQFLLGEADRLSYLEYGQSFSQMSRQSRNHIVKLLEPEIREEELYLLKYLSIW